MNTAMPQADLFAPAPVLTRERVDPKGSVLPEGADVEVIAWGDFSKHRGIRLEIAQHSDGRWMWSASTLTPAWGASYRIGPKWGQFAQSRADAISAACAEALQRIVPKANDDGMASFNTKGACGWLELTSQQAQMQ